MPVRYWLLAAAASLWRGRTLRWPIRVGANGALHCRLLRLRLYGVGEAGDRQSIAALLTGTPCRWRIVALARDGCLLIVARSNGCNPAVILLRDGRVSICGRASRRLRQVQERARLKRRGRWRYGEDLPSLREQAADRPSPFPPWQG